MRQSGLQLATCHWINTFTSTLHLSCGSFICAVPADPCLLLWSVLAEDRSLCSSSPHNAVPTPTPSSFVLPSQLTQHDSPYPAYQGAPKPRQVYLCLRALTLALCAACHHLPAYGLGVASMLSRWFSPLHAFCLLPRSKVHLQASLRQADGPPGYMDGHQWPKCVCSSIARSHAPSSYHFSIPC